MTPLRKNRSKRILGAFNVSCSGNMGYRYFNLQIMQVIKAPLPVAFGGREYCPFVNSGRVF